IEKLKEDWGI
ncbi:hypothetical protein BsWGS_13155, partial [Bradybaena similaris]